MTSLDSTWDKIKDAKVRVGSGDSALEYLIKSMTSEEGLLVTNGRPVVRFDDEAGGIYISIGMNAGPTTDKMRPLSVDVFIPVTVSKSSAAGLELEVQPDPVLPLTNEPEAPVVAHETEKVSHNEPEPEDEHQVQGPSMEEAVCGGGC